MADITLLLFFPTLTSPRAPPAAAQQFLDRQNWLHIQKPWQKPSENNF